MKFRYSYLKYIFLFLVGGFTYGIVEMLYKGGTHISMILAGGVCFLLIGFMNQRKRSMSLVSEMLISGGIITIIEFVTGYFVNIRMNLHVWDYSHIPYNYKGQICLIFSCIWVVLSLGAILLDDYINYWLLGGKKPHYKIL